MTGQRIDFLDIPLNTGVTIEDICMLLPNKGQLRMVTFVNPSSWALARRNTEFRQALDDIPLILPDGEGVAKACRWLTGLPCLRISFDMSSLADAFFRVCQKEKATVMLVGGVPNVDEQVAEKLSTSYKSLKIVGTQHGFGDLDSKVAAVMEKAPDVVIAGMGSPRQEMFLLALRDAGYKGMALTCGGFFDQYLVAENYYPYWVNKLDLRFAWRLYKEPNRLWRRYLIDYQIFIREAFDALLKKNAPKTRQLAKDTAAKLRRS